MNIEFLLTALLAISIFTNLTVEAVKKLFDKQPAITYSTNVVAAVIAVVLSVVASISYILWMGISVDVRVIMEVILLSYMSFLVATLGYDKIVQSLQQIRAMH